MQNDVKPPRSSKTDIVIDEKKLDKTGEAVLTAAGLPPHKKLAAHIKHHWWNFSKKQKIIASVATIVILIAVFIGIYTFFNGGQAPFTPSNPAKEKTKKPVAVTIASPLTGVQVDPAAAARPVTGIMIENSLDARPQSGLQDAGVVYEAIAEAGITRFLALFQEGTPQYIGPVRSLRPYFIDYAAPYQASIVHVGGSPDALAEVQSGPYRNLDQFYNGSYFTRVSSRYAPHNVYTGFNLLDKLNQSKGYTKSTFTPWPRKADSKLAAPTAKVINLAVSSSAYHVQYEYYDATNSYVRSEGGAPHIDLVSPGDSKGVRLNPKVVVALVVPLADGQLDSSGAYYSNYSTSGTGTAYVFQDGGVTQATWTKNGTTGPLQFTDAAGQPLKLDAGQTWVTLVGSTSQVSYTP